MKTTILVAAALLLPAAVLAQPESPGKRVRINGMQMYYEVSRQGDPLIVLHGAYMNIPSMGAIVPKLAATHRVYALEFQGHGRTTDIDRPITYANSPTTWRPSWMRSGSPRPTSSATRWAQRRASNSPSVTRAR